MARLIDRLIRNPEAEWEDVMVMPLNIITRQSTDIYANNDPHIAEVLRYIHENISQKITVDDLVKLVPCRAACSKPVSKRAWAPRSTITSSRLASKR